MDYKENLLSKKNASSSLPVNPGLRKTRGAWSWYNSTEHQHRQGAYHLQIFKSRDGFSIEMNSLHVGSPAALLAERHRSASGHPLTFMLELLSLDNGEINLSL